MLKIYRSMLSRLVNGKLAADSMMPKEVELAEEFNTNRMNAHRVMKVLEKNGFVISKKRVGTKVCPDVDRERLLKLLNETNRCIYVLYSMTPHWIHWNEASFAGLEEVVEPEGFSVNYCNIPTGSDRAGYEALLSRISAAGASALVIFPDQEDSRFLIDNADLLLNFQMPMFMLNRGGEAIPTHRVSLVSMDHFGDGVELGSFLRKNHCGNVIMLNEGLGIMFWALQRFEGLKLSLTRNAPYPKAKVRNILNTEKGLAEVYDLIANSKDRITVVGANNEHAANLIDYCAAKGLHPPRDYNLVAFDENPLYRSYKLTSMGVPTREVGQIFGKMICDNSPLSPYKSKMSIKVSSFLTIRETFKPDAV